MAIRSRAVLLPYMADPYLLGFWLRGFKNIWYNEVDRLYIHCASPMEKEVIDYIEELCNDPKITLIYKPQIVQHGTAIDNMLEVCTEEYVCLIEDDAFVIRQGALDSGFLSVELGLCDVVASPRGSCSTEILKRGEQLWGVPECNFWPCFVFCRRQTLLDTDRNFDSKRWQEGEYISPLAWVAPFDVVGDTFVNTSLQLRGKGLRIRLVEQYHSYVTDVDNYHTATYIFNGQCPWFHVGSLSTGVSGVLMDDRGRELCYRKIKEPKDETILPPHCNTEQERSEWERRVAWWQTFVEEAPKDKIQEFRALYESAVERIIRSYKLNRKQMQMRNAVFKKIMGKYYD